MPNWFAPTHHDWLVANEGLDPSVFPLVDCACGVRDRCADYMVDVTGLPDYVRDALGIAEVDYLCDGCVSRLFRDRHITQEDFNKLLGAPEENLALVRTYDVAHEVGATGRARRDRPRHSPVSVSPRLKGTRLALAPGAAPPTLPLKRRVMRHSDSVARLQRVGVLAPRGPVDQGGVVIEAVPPDRAEN